MFVYDTTNTETLKTYLSEERLKPYFIKSRGDSWIAFALYIRNTEISSSLYVPLQAFEVALRNIVHARMSEALNSEGWWAKLPLGAKELKDVDKAKSYLLSRQPDKTRSLENITTGQIVAELGFGFWTKLFSNQ